MIPFEIQNLFSRTYGGDFFHGEWLPRVALHHVQSSQNAFGSFLPVKNSKATSLWPTYARILNAAKQRLEKREFSLCGMNSHSGTEQGAKKTAAFWSGLGLTNCLRSVVAVWVLLTDCVDNLLPFFLHRILEQLFQVRPCRLQVFGDTIDQAVYFRDVSIIRFS